MSGLAAFAKWCALRDMALETELDYRALRRACLRTPERRERRRLAGRAINMRAELARLRQRIKELEEFGHG